MVLATPGDETQVLRIPVTETDVGQRTLQELAKAEAREVASKEEARQTC